MDQNEQKEYIFKDICLSSIFCKDNSCQLDHSRIFVGVCIDYLRDEQQYYNDGGDDFSQSKCKNKNCNLWHFNSEKFNDQVSKKPINGIYPHNLCPKSCKSEDCKYLHREWAQKVCFDYILKVCRKAKCDFNHVRWEADFFKEEAKSCSIIKDTTPEDQCEKEKCNCGKHPVWLKDYCVRYLKGICPNKKCLKNHTDWEKINNRINQTNAVKSCIVIAKERKKLTQDIPSFNEIVLLCQESEFNHYKKWFQEQNIIDVVFIMDLTGSMKPWKEIMQKTIAKIIDSFLNSINGYQVRVAFVGYRDICDGDDKLVYFSFTKKINEIQNFIQKIEVKGGGDEAEDVVSAFEQALKLNFSHHQDSLLCTFLLADAPCHGRDYHNIQSDDLIDKMPKNYFENVLEKYKQIKKNNFLCCVKINNRTDIMFEKMKAIIPLLTITTEKKPEELVDVVGFTLRMSVTESKKLKSQINDKFQYFKADFEKLKLDTIVTEYEDENYWKAYHEMIDSLKRKGQTGLKISIDINELNKEKDNSSTYIFKAFDAINNREVILKIPKKIVDNKGPISNEDIKEAEEIAQVRFYSSCYACQMAYFFNQRLKDYKLLNEMQPLFYAHPILYKLDTPFYGMKTIYGETFIQIKYKFEKYTTNSVYSDKNKYFYSAFSHFSFQASQKNLVIMDLQGCNNILADPSIQTDQNWNSILDKDDTNRKNKGIEDFISIQHKECSQLCKKLQLQQINQNSQINPNSCPQELLKNIYGICYDCDEFVNLEVEPLENEKNKKYKFNCQFCLTESQNILNSECKCCHYIYQTPINKEIKQQTNLGLCQDCKNKCINQANKCLYCKRSCQKILKEITINNSPYYLCENALEYLQAFQCNKCNKPYKRNCIISIEDYDKKSFSCC
ncbi:unnamed protein product [Paramecium primaurelia]|uniref:Alpha-type protein kinase domain-containing protein n=1 Tax=Paramecium primaurelia TaxID=5886 RepID=A0A8S1MY23_PARPR|nr:unnamed protein product [Paramecium primaurelia]